MRILMVSQAVPYLPCHDGFRVIPANLLAHLSERHEIHLLASRDRSETEQQLEWSKRHCASVHWTPPEQGGFGQRLALLRNGIGQPLIDETRRLIAALKPDVLHLEGPSSAPLARLAPAGVRCVLSAHDSLSLRYTQFAGFATRRGDALRLRFRAWMARRAEARWYSVPHHVVITSPSDRDALSGATGPGKISVIPNGIGLDQWRYQPQPEPGRIVFTGNMSWAPNEDAAEYYASEVLPKVREQVPSAQFWVVGASPSQRVRSLEQKPGVKVTGTVSDIREYVWPASVYVSPLRFGAGVKNKILEAMALGPPIVATPPSLTGTPLQHERHLLIARTPAELAASTVRLLNDPAFSRRLSEEARRVVETSYGWLAIAEQFEKVWMGQSEENNRK